MQCHKENHLTDIKIVKFVYPYNKTATIYISHYMINAITVLKVCLESAIVTY